MKYTAFLLALLACRAQAQPVVDGTVAFFDCVKETAERFATTKELPSDIATAAVVKCQRHIPDAARSSDAYQQQGRKAAVWFVLDARYPDKKKK